MRHAIWAVPAILLTVQASIGAAEVDKISRGTEISVRTIEPIRLNHWDRGRIYQAEVARNVYATDGDVAFPRGARAELIVRDLGHNEMVLDLDSVIVNGRRFVVDTSGPGVPIQTGHEREGVGGNERTAKYVGGGAIIGSIIGAIAGGGKGAAIGAAAGAGAGASTQMLTRGREIHVPPESLLTFRLDRPLRYVDYADRDYYDRGGHRYHDYWSHDHR